ncbi:TRAP transporter small permease subunit [Elioraea thermophila]|uniref:TRAP transporter small permease subunit n=1 Tax=Elioraea thermophila TaxID=2185104 RepID=UPI000DF1956A|nr:TRAP transporter small permease [Elioraea thermophila]
MSGRGLEEAVRRVTRVLAWASGAIILAGCGLLITVDVVTRAIFRRGMVESFELSGYALAVAIGLGAAWTVTSKGNIRVDILLERLPTALRRGLDLVAALAFAIVAAALAWFAFGTLAYSWSIDARSVATLRTPLWLPQALWWAGLAWLAIVALLTPILALRALVARDAASFDRLIGPTRVEEEIAEAGTPLPKPANDRAP